MTMTDVDELDMIIERFDMEAKTGRTHEELRKLVHKGMTCLNLAYCLTDVIDWLIFDVDATLGPFGAALERKDKQLFGAMKKSLSAARQQARDITRDVHREADKNGFQGECDWWYNLIRLVEDRTGNDELKTKQVIQWLSTMPSQMNMFDVHTKDFKRLLG
jgi:hypothetical protein